ncbi:MAG: relaxase/mobilization nuclease domain-containing protein [Chitinophagales bacterium]|nr:relaxase/mobilization nuclease domain-containing protein [Chitinophagales bacterium]
MMHDKDRFNREQGESFTLQHNVKGKTIPSWVKQFEKNEAGRVHQRSNSVVIYHDVLSFSNRDTKNLSLEKIEDMGRKYIELRNENALYIAIPHQDKDHWHVHFCISGVEISGLANRVSRGEFANIKKELERYQIEKYPELSNSIVHHDTPKKKEILSEKEFQLTKRTKMPSERVKTKELVGRIYKESNSKEDFYKRLGDAGLKTYNRGGRVYGIDGDRKMRFSTLGFDEKKIESLDVTLEFDKIRDDSKNQQYDKSSSRDFDAEELEESNKNEADVDYER